MSEGKKGLVRFVQEFSIPLIAGVVVALLFANMAPEKYAYYFGVAHGDDPHVWLPFGHASIFGHHLSLQFLINDIFMVFFFGIAAKEITEATLPGGSLNPIKKAVNPLLATIGGVLGPVAVFFLALQIAWSGGMFSEGVEYGTVARGWGIPTATDIALAWLVARTVFGAGHPAIDFLLLLAVADDAIGLGIIAIFYGDPENPARPAFLLLVLAGMVAAYLLRRKNVQSWLPYVLVGGTLSWAGLILAHLHPALALVFIVPFLPPPRRDTGLFIEQDEVDRMGDELAADLSMDHSPLHEFEHQLKLPVDFGLFFFALGNAGVEFASMGPLTWIILAALVVGKTVGITAFAWIGSKIGFPLPNRVGMRQLVLAAFIAALGLTVALFVAGAAFTDAALQGEAKMGALFSGGVAVVAIVLGVLLRARDDGDSKATDSEPSRAPSA